MNSMVKSCEMMGHEVFKVNFTEFKKQRGAYWKKRAAKLGIKSIEENYYQKMNLQFIETTKKIKPDICIFINGKNITRNFLMYLKENQIPTRLFMIDSIQTNVFRPFYKNLSYYDKVFSYEPTDLEFLKDKHQNINYLFVGYDSSIFYPFQETKPKEYDICFVGSLYPSRLVLLEQVAKYAQSHNKKMIVHTTSRYPKKNIWYIARNFLRHLKFKSKYSYLNGYVVDVPLFNEKLSEIYQKSKICINMHAGIGNKLHSGPNPRTFEILGSKSFQLIDEGHLRCVELENKQHLIEYRTAEELCAYIKYYLNDDNKCNEIAAAGYEFAKVKYTMEECMKRLLD